MSHPLQQRNTRSLLTWLPLVMLAGSVFFYLTLIGHIQHMKHQQLQLKQNNVWKAYASDTLHVPARLPGEYNITAAAAQTDLEMDSANLAMMIQTHQLAGQSYRVTTYISAKEYRHLLIKVSIAEGIIFILLLVSIVIINRSESRRLWTPFYTTMNAVRGFGMIPRRGMRHPAWVSRRQAGVGRAGGSSARLHLSC